MRFPVSFHRFRTLSWVDSTAACLWWAESPSAGRIWAYRELVDRNSPAPANFAREVLRQTPSTESIGRTWAHKDVEEVRSALRSGGIRVDVPEVEGSYSLLREWLRETELLAPDGEWEQSRRLLFAPAAETAGKAIEQANYVDGALAGDMLLIQAVLLAIASRPVRMLREKSRLEIEHEQDAAERRKQEIVFGKRYQETFGEAFKRA